MDGTRFLGVFMGARARARSGSVGSVKTKSKRGDSLDSVATASSVSVSPDSSPRSAPVAPARGALVGFDELVSFKSSLSIVDVSDASTDVAAVEAYTDMATAQASLNDWGSAELQSSGLTKLVCDYMHFKVRTESVGLINFSNAIRDSSDFIQNRFPALIKASVAEKPVDELQASILKLQSPFVKAIEAIFKANDIDVLINCYGVCEVVSYCSRFDDGADERIPQIMIRDTEGSSVRYDLREYLNWSS